MSLYVVLDKLVNIIGFVGGGVWYACVQVLQ